MSLKFGLFSNSYMFFIINFSNSFGSNWTDALCLTRSYLPILDNLRLFLVELTDNSRFSKGFSKSFSLWAKSAGDTKLTVYSGWFRSVISICYDDIG